MNKRIQAETADLIAHGYRQVTLAAFDVELRAIGYRLDASMACRSTATIQTGPRAGSAYPAVSLYARQVSDGVSAYNVDARRDVKYEAFKALRNSRFAIVRGAVATL